MSFLLGDRYHVGGIARLCRHVGLERGAEVTCPGPSTAWYAPPLSLPDKKKVHPIAGR